MSSALASYSKSLSQAQSLEEDGSLVVEQQGGSAHGQIEVLYRLHASRLKCVLFALQHCDDEREAAELEGLRLTEPYAYAENEEKDQELKSTRDRVWKVVVDIVNALVHCRSRHSCFHRSVYRHAQALMWAPVICDPETAKKEGSFGTVSAVKALNLRGLNSESAVESASTVMRALFDKKRAQLCAVWVTSSSIGSDFAFQRINMEARKYDALRGKYVSAFVSCLKMCNKRDDLENFLRWTASCKRDLPSCFVASAVTGGSENSTHTSDTLVLIPRSLSCLFFLTTVKREANAALASVIQQQVMASNASPESKSLGNQLKLAYSCFLRLNCDPSAVLAKRRIRESEGIKEVVDALVAIHSIASASDSKKTIVSSNNWSMDSQGADLLSAALTSCGALFPSLSSSFFSSKKITKKKKAPAGNDAHRLGGKRKEPDGSFTVVQQFSARIPNGLTAGESFLTEIQAGGKIKRIRLTVPEGAASNLRFSLRVPAPDSPCAEKD